MTDFFFISVFQYLASSLKTVVYISEYYMILDLVRLINILLVLLCIVLLLCENRVYEGRIVLCVSNVIM